MCYFVLIKQGIRIPSGAKTEEAILKIVLFISGMSFTTSLIVYVSFLMFQINPAIQSSVKKLKLKLTYFDDILVSGKFSNTNLEFEKNLFDLNRT